MKKMITLSAILVALFGALANVAAAAQPPTNPPLPFGTIPWGLSSSTWQAVALLDGGVQTSLWVAEGDAYVLSVTCTAVDAGAANAALGSITLLGSNTAGDAGAIVLGSVQTLNGAVTTLAWDPISSGLNFFAVQVDGGGTVAGTVGCQIHGKGGSSQLGNP